MKLEQFVVKPKMYSIGGEEFPIWPLSVEELPLLLKLQAKETKGEALREIIKLTLKKGDPTITDEFAGSLSVEILTDMSNAIAEVNGIKDKVEVKK